MIYLLLLPAIIMLILSFSNIEKSKYILPVTSLLILFPSIKLFFLPRPYSVIGKYLVADDLSAYIMLVSSIVAICVTLAMSTLGLHVKISKKAYSRFYRFFAIFWIGLTLSILANNMGLYWIGLETATLSTVYMIKTNNTAMARKEAWNYMIVGAIAISLILFGIILIYASAKPILGEDAMIFSSLLEHAKEIKSPFLFEIGFAITTLGMFIKMGFFPMNLWLANIERASFYPVAALFSGILESAVMIGFFRFSKIAQAVDLLHVFIFVFIYTILTIFIVSFLIYRAKDFMRLFSLSGVEHMALIALFWASGGIFAALLHFGAHAFLKPALFLSTGILESSGKYKIAGALRGYRGIKGKIFYFLTALFLLSIVSLPPSPMFFSELYGFAAMVNIAKLHQHLLLMIGAIIILLILLSIIFYKFIEIYQSMKYEGKEETKVVYGNEVLALIIFAISLMVLLTPWSFEFLRGVS
ncbi:MAG: hydrogenase [Epsilonproteobacteria bacterium]|nr:hydrogenase [Campylobacterota bacterium]